MSLDFHKKSMSRITPEYITSISENQVFVFGSNLAGRHGGGAARTALEWGAKWGQAVGLAGNTYALPTKSADVGSTLPLSEIQSHVLDFIEFARSNPTLEFLVTEIGCGLAGLDPKDIAPMFQECCSLENVWLPERFWQILKDKRK